MKALFALTILIFSSFAPASIIKVPCSSDRVEIESVNYNHAEDTTDVKISLHSDWGDEGFGKSTFLKTVIDTLAGQVEKNNVEVELEVKVNIFKRIKICQLHVSSK